MSSLSIFTDSGQVCITGIKHLEQQQLSQGTPKGCHQSLPTWHLTSSHIISSISIFKITPRSNLNQGFYHFPISMRCVSNFARMEKTKQNDCSIVCFPFAVLCYPKISLIGKKFADNIRWRLCSMLVPINQPKHQICKKVSMRCPF